MTLDAGPATGQPVNMASTDYLDMQGAADLLGVKYETVQMYRHRGRIPEPDAVFGRAPVWKRRTLERWDADRPKNENARRQQESETP